MELKYLEAINYIKSLVGTKYKFWHPNNNMLIDDGPFWACNNKAPDKNIVVNSSCSCTGVINLIYRKLGMKIPGVESKSEYAGGTYEWFSYLTLNNMLEIFDINKKYPIGTLLIRNYQNEYDQGHVAVIISYGKLNVLYEKIIHSYTDDIYNKEYDALLDPGISITILGQSHFITQDGYYTHVSLPDKWLKASIYYSKL